MSKDNLEQFVRDNREAFDDAVPSLKVWAMLDDQLPEQQTKVISLRRVLQIAAAVVVLLGCGTLIGTYIAGGETPQLQAIVNQMPEELEEIEQYYQKQVDAKYQQLASYKHDQSLENDLEQLDETMDELKKELLVAPKGKEEEIIKNLIEGYQTKILILERVLQRIQSTTKEQSKPEENEISI
jgi:vacuolar-type H+-ATPase subunit I/STV1